MTDPNSNDEARKTDTPPPQPSGRWVQIALAVSLAVNLAIAGVIAGAMFRHGEGLQAGMSTREPGFGVFTEALSKEERAKLRRAFWAAVPQMRDGHNAMRVDVAELLAELRAKTLDADGLRKLLDRQSTRTSERLVLGQHLILDLIVGMTDEERLAFADRLEQGLSKRPNRHDAPQTP